MPSWMVANLHTFGPKSHSTYLSIASTVTVRSCDLEGDFIFMKTQQIAKVRNLALSSSDFLGSGMRYCFWDLVLWPVAMFIRNSFGLSLMSSWVRFVTVVSGTYPKPTST